MHILTPVEAMVLKRRELNIQMPNNVQVQNIFLIGPALCPIFL